MDKKHVSVARLSMQLGRAMCLIEQLTRAAHEAHLDLPTDLHNNVTDALGGWHRFMYHYDWPEEESENSRAGT